MSVLVPIKPFIHISRIVSFDLSHLHVCSI